MKNTPLLLAIFSILMISCKNDQKKESVKSDFLAVKNPIALERLSEIVKIKKNEFPGDVSAVTLQLEDGSAIPFQTVDTDQDGNWDELVLALDFKPNEEKKIIIARDSTTTSTTFKNTTDVHFGIGKDKASTAEVQEYTRIGDPRTIRDTLFFQMEGPSWENDKVGFRIYFDPRNGIDIFGKTTDTLALKHVGLLKGDYHKQDSWGMDVLKVSNSLGAGSIAISMNDKLYRITGKNSATFKALTEGPVMASFVLEYPKEEINGDTISVTHKINIYKGRYYYESEVSFKDLPDNMNMATGIVNLRPNEPNNFEKEDYYVLSSYGNQSENNDNLGMAVLADKNKLIKTGILPEENEDINNTYFVTLKAQNDKPVKYYFYSGWSASDSAFTTASGFNDKLSELAMRLSHPIQVLN